MEGKIFKILDNITEKEILDVCQFEKVDNDFGMLLSMQEFMKDVECGGFIDYDGNGEIVIGDKQVRNSCTNIGMSGFWIGNKLFVPFDKLHKVFGEQLRVNWYNK